MRAAAFTSPNVLELLDLPVPDPAPGEVRIRVRAAGVQPFDLAVGQGWLPPGVPDTWPRIPGNEVAGIVDALGDGVTGFAVGAEVLAFTRLNSYAEYTVIPADQIVPKPPKMPWDVAGAFPAAIMTPHIALEELNVGPGTRLLIHAAAGGVGATGVQLAIAKGATVIGTASPANHGYLRSVGALPVAYGPGLVERVLAISPTGVDAVIDGAGGQALLDSLRLVPTPSQIITLVEHEKAESLGVRVTPFKRSAARLAEAVALYESGHLDLPIRGTFPLAGAAAAQALVATGHGLGKTVILVS
ncbi:NADP-dependent oxidoreductase [Actinocorallia lasiicapitis]